MKRTLTVAALAAALAVPAVAQQQPSAPSMPSQTTTIAPQTGFVRSQGANEWRGSKLIGASIYGPDNSSIGEINDVILGSDGRIKAAVIGVGGFLGVGEKNVAVPFEALNVSRKPNSDSIDKITVSYTKDQLKNAPKFAYYQPSGSSSQTTGSSTGMGSTSPSGSSNTMKK